MTHEQKERLIGAVIAFALALLSIFGYNVAVVQPAIERAQTLAGASYVQPVDCDAVVQCVEAGR